MTSTPVRDWVLPRLEAMVNEAETAGMDRLAVVAVITDLISGGDFNTVELAQDPVKSPVSDMAHEPIVQSDPPLVRGGWFQGGYRAD